MAFLPRLGGDFTPLFHLLDDYDAHRSTCPKSQLRAVRSFVPKFDVRELDHEYHLDGELPGVDQNDIEIEFTDPSTLVIKGRAERNYGNTNSDVIDKQSEETFDDAPRTKPHQPTVEDADESVTTTPASTPVESSNKPVAKTSSPAYKYWVSERSIGEFHRTFAFPTRIDQDLVKASLRNGILSVVVPKEPAPKLKKIRVE
ncbi:hypothetical protein ASPWEDRAFT_130791 [Aspergillus wentii DTO 134E9]|uniref:SHSP domain-containing protein n=1 Tax=Aspergillus wentii DTO 134E9 TaxID=1073089 RepID=A0A1L9RPD9_ASPWE|nr:uncharacterized protein ASPWEDRAFT_130791 [Aspergillus wentii DTO 134E9]KAI9923517.1 hypothetical protein MW887_008583 [Aspergillus wentii]OJJ36762.1 hypothetical protein ASPWEDRAFT_130791 [Aspergillus wentii DTO 134E9]